MICIYQLILQDILSVQSFVNLLTSMKSKERMKTNIYSLKKETDEAIISLNYQS